MIRGPQPPNERPSDGVGEGALEPLGFEEHPLGNCVEGSKQGGQFAVAHLRCAHLTSRIVDGTENGEADCFADVVMVRVHDIATSARQDGCDTFAMDDLLRDLLFDVHLNNPSFA